MTPGARIEAAIGLLHMIGDGASPADDTVANYFRRHRFAGVKDRAAISKHIYGVLRHRGVIDWWLERNNAIRDARRRMFAQLALYEEWEADKISQACDGDQFRPGRLDRDEIHLVEALAGQKPEHRDMPLDARCNFPGWLTPFLERALGREVPREMAAMQGEAPLDLRANMIKSDREAVFNSLALENIPTGRTPLSPIGLRIFERVPLGQSETFRRGDVEVQDEGSQIAALMADVKPGMRVVDFCAGAGGKTLALAGQMKNRGHLVACDIATKRLERATQRLRRAGASIVQRIPLAGANDKWVKRHAAGFDCVFVDAPCTGTGTWRRNPDAKWRLRPRDIEELTVIQAEILASAQRLVKPGGRLVYATCSMLMEEDEDQIDKFLNTHPDFTLTPIADVWRDAIGGECPARGDMLRLTPARHHTDGFFVAVMKRKAAPKKEPKAKKEDGAEETAALADEESAPVEAGDG
jgi:16S rRNA (cytosine967-C5)-methyltransferase